MAITPAFTQLVVDNTSTSTALVSSSITVSNGDILVVKAVTESAPATPTTPTATGQTFTLRTNSTAVSNVGAAIYTAVVTGNPGTLTISANWSGSGRRSAVFERWLGTEAKLGANPAVNATKTGTFTATTTMTTVSDGSVVTWLDGDWSAQAPGTPALASSATLEGVHDVSPSSYVSYFGYQQAATKGTQTFGVSSPAGQTWTLLGLEILDIAGLEPQPPTLRQVGTATSATALVTAVNPAVPALTTTGDISVLQVWVKPYNVVITTPAGWTKIGENTIATTTVTPDSMGAIIHSYQKPSTATWDTSVFTTGGVNPPGAVNYSATGAAGLNVNPDDMVIAVTAVGT